MKRTILGLILIVVVLVACGQPTPIATPSDLPPTPLTTPAPITPSPTPMEIQEEPSEREPIEDSVFFICTFLLKEEIDGVFDLWNEGVRDSDANKRGPLCEKSMVAMFNIHQAQALLVLCPVPGDNTLLEIREATISTIRFLMDGIDELTDYCAYIDPDYESAERLVQVAISQWEIAYAGRLMFIRTMSSGERVSVDIDLNTEE